jgi:hypothetical protein
MGKLHLKLDRIMQSETGDVLSLTCVNRFNIVLNEISYSIQHCDHGTH